MLEYRIFIIIEMLRDACNDSNSSSTAAVVVTVTTSIHPASKVQQCLEHVTPLAQC